MFIVKCRVSGGVTGTRESELKKDGKVQEFATREEAETVAAQLNRPRPYATADFRYWVEERADYSWLNCNRITYKR